MSNARRVTVVRQFPRLRLQARLRLPRGCRFCYDQTSGSARVMPAGSCEPYLRESQRFAPRRWQIWSHSMIDRNAAWGIVCEHVKDRGLRRHMQAVEAAMRVYAGKFGGNPDQWGITGLLHDFDWEI